MIPIVDIFLFDDVDLRNFTGPFEVFGVAAARRGQAASQVRTVALNRGPVPARHGLSVNPTPVVGSEPVADRVVVPGGYGRRVRGNRKS